MADQKIKVLILTALYAPGYKGGGPIKSISNLVKQIGDTVDCKIVTGDRDLGDTSPYSCVAVDEWNSLDIVPVFYARTGMIGLAHIIRILIKERAALVYLNSLFSIRFAFIPLLAAILLKRKIILSPRGELSDGALALKPIRKRLFLAFFKYLKLREYILFQASTGLEAQDIHRALDAQAKVFLAENIGSQEFAQKIHLRSSQSLKAVVISRISPKKNLLAALEMLRNVKYTLEYHIYGPIEDADYWRQCEDIIVDLPSHITVKHMGALVPSEVVTTLSKYDVFFFPTKGENYGHVIAEALCAALPLVISDTTPWRNLRQQGIGWDLPLNNPAAFINVLGELATMPPQQHLEMRQNVLAWAQNRFSQRDAIEANIAMFKYASEKK